MKLMLGALKPLLTQQLQAIDEEKAEQIINTVKQIVKEVEENECDKE
jgi:hypothetical protein